MEFWLDVIINITTFYFVSPVTRSVSANKQRCSYVAMAEEPYVTFLGSLIPIETAEKLS